jgi:hypothetical protein|eukprot:CAMPEP_0174320832 /NCGR_PEP_ID=MMETSP0810-20121108/9838_1 /TAXON_ID=73025 ORGANISM="Eutreptiella gymnastica-like, Strain CCMP1594" /NCGR_SAMPLE_ID=MMETSP0810 /ASSEMBLY_ACC=CAM_ASM_000659 /LENGTH=534 /DNA_ID=CAMNT_0015431927 /DNA_START=23 /DNA_END=1627 /DNA_ORIENTATION=-
MSSVDTQAFHLQQLGFDNGDNLLGLVAMGVLGMTTVVACIVARWCRTKQRLKIDDEVVKSLEPDIEIGLETPRPHVVRNGRSIECVAGLTFDGTAKNATPTTASDPATFASDGVVRPFNTAGTSPAPPYAVASRALLGATPDSAPFQGNGTRTTPASDVIDVELCSRNAQIPADQIYFAVIGRNPKTQAFSYLKSDGTMIACALGDNGKLHKGGQAYTNYFWTLAESKTLRLPKMDSGRIFVSVHSPMYIQINVDVNGHIGFTGPNMMNPTDPNLDVYFDWYEFTYNNLGLWINTTQVDQFCIPMTVECIGEGKRFHKKVGLTESRDTIFKAFANEVPVEFHGLVQLPYRISAPCKCKDFNVQLQGKYCHYMDRYVDGMWTYLRTHTITIDMWENTRRFCGKVIDGDVLEFTEVDYHNPAYVGGTFYVRGKPNTQEVFEGSGHLATGNTTELAIQAQVCAALNRHVMDDGTKWHDPSAFYPSAGSSLQANYYAKFWHAHSIGGKAYGFAYDDVAEQSSTIHTTEPENLILEVGW